MLVQQNIQEKYLIGEEIGRGQFGTVFKAFKRITNEGVCVKVFQKKQQFGENVLETKAESELEIVRKMMGVNAKNLVKILEVIDIENEDKAYIVMELCDCNLNGYVENKQFTKEQKDCLVKDFIKQIVEGYTQLSNEGIIHRDMKPDNILIQIEGGKPVFKVIYLQIQIADFGLGKLLDDKEETSTKNIGTPYYTAPEIERKNKVQSSFSSYTDKCDIFSFGIIIFELLVGNNKFNTSQKLLLKEKKFKDVFEKELTNVQPWFKELLNEMIVHDKKKRISWQNLKLILDFDLIIKKQIQVGNGITGDITEGEVFSSHNKVCVKVIEKGSIYSLAPSEGYNFQNQNLIKTLKIIDKGYNNQIIQVMEHCDFNLTAVLDKDIDVLDFMEQIINGVLTLKSRQLYHCQLTGESILIKQVDDKMIYKLTDFYRKTSQQQEKQKSQQQEISENQVKKKYLSQLAWIVIELCTKNKCSFDECSAKLQTLHQVGNYKSLVTLLNEILVNHIDWNLILSRIKDIRNEKQKEALPSSQMNMASIQFQQKKQFSTIAQPQMNCGFLNNQEATKQIYCPNANFSNFSNKQPINYQFALQNIQPKGNPSFPQPPFQQQVSQIPVFKLNSPQQQTNASFQPAILPQPNNSKFQTINRQNSFKVGPNIGDAPKKEMFENNISTSNNPPCDVRQRTQTQPLLNNPQSNNFNQRNSFPNQNFQFYNNGKN